MSEVSLVVGGFGQPLTLRLDPNSVQGCDLAGQPALRLPLQMQLLPGGQHGDLQYMLLWLRGTLLNPRLGEFATFEFGPLAEAPNPAPFYRPYNATVILDRQRIRRFEDARSGDNAYFQIMLSGLVWYPAEKKFEAPASRGNLDVLIPKSHWAEDVVSRWNLSSVKVIEIEFPTNAVGENLRAAYQMVEAAERFSANGQYKQALAELYSAFEGLAKSQGYTKPDQQYFASLLEDYHSVKKECLKLALDNLCDFFQLGRHEPKDSPETFVILRRDVRFALTMARAVFEYITAAG